MSARKPFFPQSPVNSGSAAPVFVPDPTNALHASGKDSEQAEGAKKTYNPFKGSGNPSGLQNNTARPGTAGLGRLKKRVSADHVEGTPSAPMNAVPVTRPGTANPFSRPQDQPQVPKFAPDHIPLMAPTPQKANRNIPSLLAHKSGSNSGASSLTAFKTPYATESNGFLDSNSDINAHISTSDTMNAGSRSAPDDFNQNIAFRPASRANGPQRVPIDQDLGLLNRFVDNQHHTLSANNDNDVNEKERVSFNPPAHTNKRAREESDDDFGDEYGNARQLKRFKTRNGSIGQERDIKKTLSPASVGRPSSGMSRSMSMSYHGGRLDTPPFHHHQEQEYQSQRAHIKSSLNFKGYSQYETVHPSPSPPEPRALEKVLGIDPDAYVKSHLDIYDEMMQRWSNCTAEEWRAGADEIAADYQKLLDHVKQNMEAKLKLYSTFDATVRNHNVILDDRKLALDDARQRLINESGSVLK